MSFYKEVPGRQTTLESTLKFDTTPTEGSTNPVTSDGVKSAIDGAVGDASAALQEQIDEIAEKAGSGYIPKGEASVATLNALSGQDNGWLYTMTDAGTLTEGSLAVVAGDTVAWDATNSVWYKAMDYAPSQYGTNEVHNLATTITAFRTGDVIPVDGPSGTAKISSNYFAPKSVQDKLVASLAEEFDPERDENNPYKRGELVKHDGGLFKFISAHYGAWSDSDAIAIPIASDVDYESAVSKNASSVEWIYDGFDYQNTSLANMSQSPFILRTFDEAVVLGMLFNPMATGKLSIGYYTGILVSGEPLDTDGLVYCETLNIQSIGPQFIAFSKPLVLPAGARLVVGAPSDTAYFKYGNYGTDKSFFWSNSGNVAISLGSLGISFVGIKKNTAYIENKITKVSITDFYENEIALIDSYDVSNVSVTVLTESPFILDKKIIKNGVVGSLTLNISQSGILSVGTIKASEVVEGEPFDFSKFDVKSRMVIADTGLQKIAVPEPFVVAEDELLWISQPGDTAKYTYGVSGAEKGFYFNRSGNYKKTTSSLNVVVTGPGASKSYKGKKVSILGDSISTFEGYIPTGNVTHYPGGDVKQVTDTWWNKLINLLGAELLVNNSWSGSRVTTTAGDTSAGCMTRCQSLGDNPDVIIVWMGINDFDHEIPLGSYDGETAVPETTTTFREAYGIMLNKILTAYPTAEVWVCTLPQVEKNGPSGFPEVNGNGDALSKWNKAIRELAYAFGVKVLEHATCGMTYQNISTYCYDNLHPNKKGHSLVANNDVRQMDASVTFRYSIS